MRVVHRSTGFEPSDPYVRRFWVAAIGSSAVAELLRLVRAAEKGEAVRLPRTLPILLKTGLIKAETSGLVVFDRIPAVPIELSWRFPPSLGSEHSRMLSAADGQDGHQHQSDPFANGESEGDPHVRLTADHQ